MMDRLDEEWYLVAVQEIIMGLLSMGKSRRADIVDVYLGIHTGMSSARDE